MINEMTLYWLPFVAAIAIVVFSAYFLWKTLFADRPRGRRRCPKCWYDMAYSEGLTCSECGHTARREADFTRTRRNYGRASLALFVCVFTILGAYWKLTEKGLIASMPTSVLVAAFPLVSSSDSEVMRVVTRRMRMSQLDDQQIESILKRCVKGDWTVSPPDDAWIGKYGRFLHTIRDQYDGQRINSEFHDMELPLLDVPARVHFDANHTWPKNTRARIRVHTENWWPNGHEIKLTITNAEDPDDTRSIVQRRNRRGSNTYVLYTQPLTETTTKVAYDIEVFRRRTGDDETPWESQSVERHTLPITISETYETAIEAVEDEELDEIMKKVFGAVTRWEGGPQPVRFNLNYSTTFVEDFEGLAMGVTVELLYDGEVARQLDLWWSGGPNNRRRQYGHEVPFEDVATLLSIDTEDLEEHWKMRVRSDPGLALRAGQFEKYWKGEFTIDISALQIYEEPVIPKPLNWWQEEGETIEDDIAH